MNPLQPGQAAVARHEGKVWIVVCDERENLPLGGVAFEIRGGVHHICFGDSTVGVASVMLRLTAGEAQLFYTCFFNELEQGVVESLATQPELPIMFATSLGECVGNIVLPNGMRGMMRKQLVTISLLAEKSPWEPRQFDAAKAIVQAQFPTAAALWAKLGGE
jgi:hypothetical protein